MGGHTAAFYAYRYSSQIESLVLINNAGITLPNASEMQLAQVVIMQDTRHIPMLERPQETAAQYLEFLGSL